MTVTVAGLPFQFCQRDSASGSQGFMLKSTKDAYVFDGSALTKITDVDYPATTVPGVAFLDGYFFVMDAAGTIYNSDLEAPLNWNSLNFIKCEAEPDNGVALAKYLNYIIGFGTWTTEYFFDAANATGSPLSRVQSAAIQVGCANGYSIAQFDGKLVWMGNSRSTGRGIYVFAGGMAEKEISTPDICRILNADDLSTVYAWGAGFNGHPLYILSLVQSGVTLVYDFSTDAWSHFTKRTVGSAKSVTTLTQTNGVASAESVGHGFSDGDEITIVGADQSGYNKTVNVNVIDADNFTYPVDLATVTPATGTITATGSTEAYFDLAYYASVGGKDLGQGATNGIIYEILGTAYQDNGAPIDVVCRTAIWDNKNSMEKVSGSVEVIGDKVDSEALLRWSDDDYSTHSKYRRVDLSLKRSRVRRLGSYSRRSFDLRHTANTAFRVEALELEDA